MSKMSDEVFSNVMHDPVVGLMHAPCSLLHTGKFCSKKPYYCVRVKICSKQAAKVSRVDRDIPKLSSSHSQVI